jgi:hypothetical protein
VQYEEASKSCSAYIQIVRGRTSGSENQDCALRKLGILAWQDRVSPAFPIHVIGKPIAPEWEPG